MSTPTTTSCVIAPHLKAELGANGDGKYGRMFADLPCNECDEAALLTLGRAGSALDAADLTDDGAAPGSNPCIPAGFPIFGQFIAHNITADRSLLQHHVSIGEIRNFRTPSLNLESLYGAGPSGSPYMYDTNDSDMLLLGADDAGVWDDLPRNSQGRALIGDPRHEFLPVTVGKDIVDDVLANGRQFYDFGERPFIPIEFSDGAYRFGHSQIRAVYQLNDHASGRIFPDLAGNRQLKHDQAIDWRYFFALDPDQPPQRSRRIDARLAHPLITLPDAIVGVTDIPEQHSLAYRDLQRARALDMPSGEAIARAMGITPLTAAQVGLAARGWEGETPLWYYVMKEAEVSNAGVSLGAMGGRIVAEVLIGLLEADPTAYLNVARDWQPTLPTKETGTFTMADLLRFAGVA